MRCLLRNVRRFQKLTWSFSKQILRAWAHNDVARLSMFLIRLPGTVSKGLMPGSQKFSPKCHQMVPWNLWRALECLFQEDKLSELATLTSMLLQFFGGLIKLLVCPRLRSIQICLPPLMNVLAWVENIRCVFFLFRNSFEMLSGNFVQRRMDRSIILINGSFSNILLQLLTE